LTNASPHPVTTPAACCEAVIESIRSCSAAEVIIAEGCGDASLETDEIFDLLELDWQQIPHLSANFRYKPLQGSLQIAAKYKKEGHMNEDSDGLRFPIARG